MTSLKGHSTTKSKSNSNSETQSLLHPSSLPPNMTSYQSIISDHALPSPYESPQQQHQHQHQHQQAPSTGSSTIAIPNSATLSDLIPSEEVPILAPHQKSLSPAPHKDPSSLSGRQKLFLLIDPFLHKKSSKPLDDHDHDQPNQPRTISERFLGLFMGSADLVCFVFLVGTLPLYFIRLDAPLGLLLQLVVAVCVGCARSVGESAMLGPSSSFSSSSSSSAAPLISGTRGWLGIALELYPAGLFAVMYTLMGSLCKTADSVVNDARVQSWERRVFGESVSPSQDLWQEADSRVLGEYLHFCYFGYYFVVAALPITLYLTRPRYVLHRALGCLALVFVMGFVTFIAFPVEGPYWQYDPPDGSDTGYVFSYITYGLVDMGSSNGTAFPSSHVAASLTCLALALLFHRRLAIAYLFVVPGLCVATVYCGFHYAVDALAGCLYAILAMLLGLPLSTALLHRVMPFRLDYHDMLRDSKALPRYFL